MSNQMNPPDAPLGSPERRAYWESYWQQYGSSNESHREIAGIIQDLEEDVATHQTQLDRATYYQSIGVPNAASIIDANRQAIAELHAAIIQKESEFAQYLQQPAP